MNLQERIFLQSIGHRIRQCREAQALTQQQLGERCKLHRTFVGSVERGERNVSILNLRTFALVLRVPLSDLLAAERGRE
jgi:transcriptional regulator with XRE-family HTH domain